MVRIADFASITHFANMSRFAQVAEELRKAGWSLMPLELASDCWWATEIWELKSKWTPIGATAHLSFLVNPLEEFDPNNVPDKAVWAIGLSKDLPQDWADTEQAVIPIKRRMKDAIAEIVAEAAELRTAK